MSARYRRKVEDCDVTDRATLKRYRAKRSEWLSLLEDDPEHSIHGQLTAILWQDATFRLLNEMRVGAPGSRPATITSPLLAEALDSGYVTNMILGIGRLVDPRSDVVSLKRVFDHVRANRHIITREVYVCHDGMKYDPTTVQPPWDRGWKPGEAHWEELGGPFDTSTPRRLHETFDRLSGVQPEARQRTDLIAEATFDEIDALLSDPAVLSVRDRRHKFVAHAADAKSRANAPLARYSISMTDVEKAIRPLLRAIDKLEGQILCAGGRGFMATAQFNVLEGLGGALTDEQLLQLQDVWGRLEHERNEWHEAGAK